MIQQSISPNKTATHFNATALSTNAKKVIVQVVPRRVQIKNFKDDDSRLPTVQSQVLEKLERQARKLINKGKKKRLTESVVMTMSQVI